MVISVPRVISVDLSETRFYKQLPVSGKRVGICTVALIETGAVPCRSEPAPQIREFSRHQAGVTQPAVIPSAAPQHPTDPVLDAYVGNSMRFKQIMNSS